MSRRVTIDLSKSCAEMLHRTANTCGVTKAHVMREALYLLGRYLDAVESGGQFRIVGLGEPEVVLDLGLYRKRVNHAGS